ncbi:bifunctional aspartokinase/homoserine dehydrogenase I [Tanacetum coccineum]
MASSSSSSSYLIRFHRGGVFVRDPFSYDYEMLSEIPNVDMGAMNFVGFVKLLVSECSSDIKQIFYHVAGLSLELGLRTLKNDEDLAKYVELGAQNDNVLDIYVSHSVFDFFDATSSSKQQVGNAEHNDDSDSDLDDVYVYDSERLGNHQKKGEKADLEKFVQHVHGNHFIPNTVLVDCTSSTEVADRYHNWLHHGIHVITPNKKANSGPLDKYLKLRALQRQSFTHYFYEATVGAGLPIMHTLRDLLQTGDKIIKIEGIFRLQKMREKHAKWTDGICPNIRKKLEKYKDLHRHWNVIPSGESRFEVRNGYEGFKVDERSRSCSCRGWQLSGIPCEHGIAAIYFLHKDPENYVSDWYNKDVFVNAYNHYIEGMNGMDQWPTTDYQKPLPPVVRRMPGRPPHKRKRDAMEDDGNRTRISRKGQLNHCTLCKKPGHNQRACPSKPEVTAAGEIVTASVGKVTAAGEIVTASGGNVTASGDLVSAKGGNVTARGGKVCARGGKVTARGGIVMASGGNVSARGGKVTASGGKVTARGGKVSARGGKVSARGGKVTSTPSTPPPGFEMSTPDTASSAVRTSGGAIKLREGVWIRSPEKERSSYADTGSSSINKLRTVNGKVVSSRGRGDGSKSRMYPFGIRPIGFGVSWDPIDGQTMLGNSMGLPRHAWPEGITPQDCIIHAATQSEIALSHSQPVESQEEEPRQEEPRHQEPRQQQQRNQEPRQQPRRTSERIAQIMFNKPPTPGPGLDPDDAISLE